MGNAEFTGTQEEWDQLVIKNEEKEKQKIADQLGISVDQIETLSPEEQEAGTVKGIDYAPVNSAHSFTEGSEDHLKEQVIPEDQLKSEEEELRQFLASEENRQHALQLAEQIQQVCGEKWFSLDKLVKKSSESNQTAFQKIKICEMFGLVATRIGDHNDGKDLIRQPLFKVIISAKDKIEAIDRIIAYHNGQIKKMELDRNLLIESSQFKNEQ